MRKRLYFEKKDEMIYISHLDTIRLMERLFKISGIELEFSQGYHPRAKISFGNPISVGEISLKEPIDIVLKNNIKNEILLKKLNEKAPKGLRFIDVEELSSKGSIMSEYKKVEYEIEFLKEEYFEMFKKILDQDEMIEIKEKKDGKIQKRNLKEKIEFINFIDKKAQLILKNLSPNALLRLAKIDNEFYKIKRIKYTK
ncbi:radical SAM-linked protein [Hypnocyclicus thermotrophus]|uniref:Radical SAM-linked protein n=1 Tax=Hypnocyclicus thermotrophus TaxID=1627895 RepID=A0AA46DZG3_9FUSO|nr:TIGR03936 family radical SAM-associated protein [Hypnocyclicus thermotrophus]TDT71807.1 radical SAM-linked protein [Hypnocyclicus thermotrophus]